MKMLTTTIATMMVATAAHAGTTTFYAVQSGMIDDSSCCSPYTYFNSSVSNYVLSGCFNSTYGCGYQRERAAWRYDIAGQLGDSLPEGAEIDWARFRWNHPTGSLGATYVEVRIDANTQILSSSYCSDMRSSADQSSSIQSYISDAYSLSVDLDVIAESLEGGYLSTQIWVGGGADGTTFFNSGTLRPRIEIGYSMPEPPPGACCLPSSSCIQIEPDVCDAMSGVHNGADTDCADVECANSDALAGLSYSIVGTDLVDDAEPTWTVDVYAELAEGCRLDAVAGDVNQSKMVSTTGSFYQNPYGGPTSASVNPALFDVFPDLRYDSFVTIGRTDQIDNALSDIGIDFASFEAGGAIESTDGSWYVTPKDAQGTGVGFNDELCEPGNGVHVARLTVRGMDSSVMFEALFQGKTAEGMTWQGVASIDISNDDCMTPCLGDVDGDGSVDVTDLLSVISAWGPCEECDADIDANGYVDVTDLLTIISAWGPCS